MTKIIKSLTKDQESKIPEYIEKWVNMASGNINHTEVKKSVNQLYKNMGFKNPLIMHFSSPFMCHLALYLIKKITNGSQLRSQLGSQLDSQLYSQLDSQLRSQLDSQLRSQLGSQLDSQLYSQLDSQLRSQLDSQLRSQLYSQLYSQLDSQLYSQLYSQLRSQLDSQLRSQLYSQLRSQLYSQLITTWWLIWCGWYDYAKYIGVQFDLDKLDLFTKFNSNIHFCLPFKGLFIYSNKPKIHWNNNRLHNTQGMAIEYSDGWGWFCLNGIPMKKEYVMSKPENIDAKIILVEKDIDVRRELIRKVGVLKLKSTGKLIDKLGDYELIDMCKPLMLDSYAPHLLMKNPSLEDTWHLEGVPPDIKTCMEANNWQATGDKSIEWSPAQLS